MPIIVALFPGVRMFSFLGVGHCGWEHFLLIPSQVRYKVFKVRDQKINNKKAVANENDTDKVFGPKLKDPRG